jgi:S1-C subfamily serine protease
MTERVRPLRLGPVQFAVVAVTLLGVLPVVVWGAFGGAIRAQYLEQVVGPRVRHQFGFSVGRVRVGAAESGPDEWDAVSQVSPGSALERAGVRRGDTGCLGIDTGGLGDLYAALDRLRQETAIEVELSNAGQGRAPCRTVTIRR